MAIGDIIVGIDIGTSKVSTVVGEVNNFNQIEILCSTSKECKGMQKTKIVSEDSIAEAIRITIKQAEEETNLKINSAYVTIPGKYITIVQNSVTRDAKDKYAGISVKDVGNSIMQVKDIDVSVISKYFGGKGHRGAGSNLQENEKFKMVINSI